MCEWELIKDLIFKDKGVRIRKDCKNISFRKFLGIMGNNSFGYSLVLELRVCVKFILFYKEERGSNYFLR